jgi:hypothetical protein
MISPEEFSVGHIGDVTTSLTLALPRDGYEYPMLITRVSDAPYAIFLSGQHEFTGFECSNNSTWGGVLIPNVRIEIDESAAFDAEATRSPLGTLIRRGTQLDMATKREQSFHGTVKTPLIVGLPPCHQSMAAGFAKWRIVLGRGANKRELIRIEIKEASAG